MELLIGYHIKRLRLKHGLTQREMAEHLRVSAQAVSKWEAGLNYPDITLLRPIADLLGVTLDELFERKGADR
ncbi:MAG: helix-turn-helix transcriptional regulator [Clostridia bacterium]|nr:helix-turn-helix transcriptional regulator [Clostridia bacterium]